MKSIRTYFCQYSEKALDAKVKVSGGDLRFGQYPEQISGKPQRMKQKQWGDEYVSVEHLFLSLLTQPSPSMKKIFNEFGITRERFLQALSAVKATRSCQRQS